MGGELWTDMYDLRRLPIPIGWLTREDANFLDPPLLKVLRDGVGVHDKEMMRCCWCPAINTIHGVASNEDVRIGVVTALT